MKIYSLLVIFSLSLMALVAYVLFGSALQYKNQNIAYYTSCENQFRVARDK